MNCAHPPPVRPGILRLMDRPGQAASGLAVEVAGPQDRPAIEDLVRAATLTDGVGPLSEHARLHSARGGGLNLVARDESGAVTGFAHLDLADGDLSDGEPATGELVVRPDQRRRGYGASLAQAITERSGAAGVRVWAHGQLPGAVALAARVGAQQVRELRQMRRSLTGPDVEPPPGDDLPDDLRLRAFRVGADEDEWLRVNARAFAAYPEQGGWTIEDLRDREATDWFDAQGFLLVEVTDDPGRIAGYHWTKQHPQESGPPLGEVYVVGLDPAYQGRGLGSILTLAGLRYLRSRGLAEVMLYVDGANTPAIATYGKLGFTTAVLDVMYEVRPSG
jgi:mycothiol synthase